MPIILAVADVVELVDTPDLGSGAERCGGSTPSWRTISEKGRSSLLLRPFSFSGAFPASLEPSVMERFHGGFEIRPWQA